MNTITHAQDPDAPDPGHPIAGLRAIAERKRALARDEEALVRRARLTGSSWHAIADALGVLPRHVVNG